jgi:hypothetical protein
MSNTNQQKYHYLEEVENFLDIINNIFKDFYIKEISFNSFNETSYLSYYKNNYCIVIAIAKNKIFFNGSIDNNNIFDVDYLYNINYPVDDVFKNFIKKLYARFF